MVKAGRTHSRLFQCKRIFVRSAMENGTAKRNLICIFQLIANADAAGNSADLNLRILKSLVNLKIAGIA